jgi:hypothetical protein
MPKLLRPGQRQYLLRHRRFTPAYGLNHIEITVKSLSTNHFASAIHIFNADAHSYRDVIVAFLWRASKIALGSYGLRYKTPVNSAIADLVSVEARVSI